MICLVRALIADPFFAAKAEAGHVDDIRTCIACNQACIGHRHMGAIISCIQHPETGRERTFPHVKEKAAESRKVMVIGGGPGGMKAAAIAAERGHAVTLYEKDTQLGGQTRLAQMLPDRAEFGGIITNLSREMELAGVEVRKGVSVDAWAVIKGEANVGGRVVIADWRCDWVGMGVAQMLARNGCHVRLYSQGVPPGQNLQAYLRDHWVGVLDSLGVEMKAYARLFGADSDSVYFQHMTSGEALMADEVDTLVLGTGPPSRGNPHEALTQTWQGEMYLIGDALSPHTAEEAVMEGLQATMAL